MKLFSALLFAAIIFSGCMGDDDLVVVSKEIRRESLSLTSAGDEFGSAAGSVIENVVVGKLENKGSEDAHDVEVTFHLSGGGQNFALVAQLPTVPAGKTVEFRTNGARTYYTLEFKNDGKADITKGK